MARPCPAWILLAETKDHKRKTTQAKIAIASDLKLQQISPDASQQAAASRIRELPEET